MALAPSTNYFAPVGAVFALSNNTVEGTPGSGAPELLVAGGAGGDTAITGNTIDRESYGMPRSCLLVLSAYLNLADTETFDVAVEIQESDDGSTWDTAEALFADAAIKTASGAFTDGLAKTLTVHLGDRKRYIRFNCTPDFSASSTDTGVLQAVAVLGGAVGSADLPAHLAEDTV